ncbi:hypothetical protein HD806DRAFT_493654 [Xylariaceae sp. AK1471]|nr:hypothetical protein HD806DRAFT_493654 [Xylariaceae sp. AK1471]
MKHIDAFPYHRVLGLKTKPQDRSISDRLRDSLTGGNKTVNMVSFASIYIATTAFISAAIAAPALSTRINP